MPSSVILQTPRPTLQAILFAFLVATVAGSLFFIPSSRKLANLSLSQKLSFALLYAASYIGVSYIVIFIFQEPTTALNAMTWSTPITAVIQFILASLAIAIAPKLFHRADLSGGAKAEHKVYDI
jgi:hypothetical protein